MTETLRPIKGGFLRPFGCGQFIQEFLKGNGPQGSPRIDPQIGAPQSDIFFYYKMALILATARDRAARHEEKTARQEDRPIDPDRIIVLIDHYMLRLPYKTSFARYHSFVSYFGNLQRLGWVEPSGHQEHSTIQDNHPESPPRIFYRLTEAGLAASDADWANPVAVLYGRS